MNMIITVHLTNISLKKLSKGSWLIKAESSPKLNRIGSLVEITLLFTKVSSSI